MGRADDSTYQVKAGGAVLRPKIALICIFLIFVWFGIGCKQKNENRYIHARNTAYCADGLWQLSEPPKRVMLEIRYKVVTATAYTTGKESCGRWADGRTCYNRPAIPGRTMATDPRVLPHHRWYFIQGMGWRRAEDRGSAIRESRIDILMRNVREARRFGRKKVIVTW